ncbi:MAG: YceI family protein [Acidimicrobiales bacterium]|nr:YceI family protein [Acidimicrobiales bacterium]
MHKSAKIALAAVLALIVGGGGAFWYFVLREDSPPPASLSSTGTTVLGAEGTVPATPEGAWTAIAGDKDSFVGYRIEELFAGDTVKKTAVGRTTSYKGTLVIEGNTVVSAEVVADLTQLKSDQTMRDRTIKGRGLQTDQFPEATFKLTEPITLPAVSLNEKITVVAKGELTLHGVTKPIEVPIEARWAGAAIEVAGRAPIVLADFGIEPIRIATVTVDDQGEMDFALKFSK